MTPAEDMPVVARAFRLRFAPEAVVTGPVPDIVALTGRRVLRVANVPPEGIAMQPDFGLAISGRFRPAQIIPGEK